MGIGYTAAVVFVTDATNVGTAGRAIFAMSKRNSQHRWDSSSREIEHKEIEELHDSTR